MIAIVEAKGIRQVVGKLVRVNGDTGNKNRVAFLLEPSDVRVPQTMVRAIDVPAGKK